VSLWYVSNPQNLGFHFPSTFSDNVRMSKVLKWRWIYWN